MPFHFKFQVVVDDQLLIRNCYTGWPGCAHDARVLRNSSLYESAEAGTAIHGDHYILADTAYPLKQWLITPFRDNGHLIQEQRNFNRVVSSCRQTVERAIGHLKGRVRMLKEVPVHKAANVAQVITAGCILHNLCIMQGDDIEQYIEIERHPHPNNFRNIFRNDQAGIARRTQLVNLVNRL